MEFPLENLRYAGDDMEQGIRTLSKAEKEYLGIWEDEKPFKQPKKVHKPEESDEAKKEKLDHKRKKE